MRRQSAKFQGLKSKLISILGILFLSACSTGIETADQFAPVNNYAGLQICDQKPRDGATDVALNARIAFTVDAVLDAWSVTKDNIQVWTEDGAQFGGKLLINHEIVRADASTPNCPQNQAVSRIVIAPGSGATFIPGKTYKVLFRDRPSQTDAASEIVLGMAAQGTGARLQQQVRSFKTGTTMIGGQTSSLEVIGMTPGRILNRNGDGSSRDLGSLLSNYFTIDKRAAIEVSFNTSFKHQSYDNGNPSPTGPIPVMPLYTRSSPTGFLGVAVGVIESINTLDQVLAALGNVTLDNPTAWATALSGFFTNGQLTATLESPDRRNLIIRPTQDYPPTTGQIVVTIVQGFLTRTGGIPQKQRIYVGAFYHQGNFQTDIGMPDPKVWLREGLFR